MLKYHPNSTVARRNSNLFVRIEQNAVVQNNAAAIRLFKSCNASQEHCFARAGWPQNTERRLRGIERYIEMEIRKVFFDLNVECHFNAPLAENVRVPACASNNKVR